MRQRAPHCDGVWRLGHFATPPMTGYRSPAKLDAPAPPLAHEDEEGIRPVSRLPVCSGQKGQFAMSALGFSHACSPWPVTAYCPIILPLSFVHSAHGTHSARFTWRNRGILGQLATFVPILTILPPPYGHGGMVCWGVGVQLRRSKRRSRRNLGRPTLFNTVTCQELLDCTHSKAQILKESGKEGQHKVVCVRKKRTGDNTMSGEYLRQICLSVVYMPTVWV